MRPDTFKLYGRVVVSGNIRAVTGLRIGRGKEGVTIGGLENAVVRDPVTNVPFIPGSSLKGKLRSLAERNANVDFNWRIQQIYIHACSDPVEYKTCPVCRLYGVPAKENVNLPTRLVVRDVKMHPDSISSLRSLETDQPFTEIKWEAAIDRVSSAATPRSMERVPADTVFGPFEMVFTLYDPGDPELVSNLLDAMSLLEDDYLGGTGSRGSGKVKFENLEFVFKPAEKYQEPVSQFDRVVAEDLDKARQQKAEIERKTKALVGKAGGG